MDLEKAIVVELNTIDEIKDKIYPVNAQETVKAPYVIYVASYGLRHKTLDGYETGKVIPVEINLVANNQTELKVLTTKIIDKVLSFPLRTIGNEGLYVSDLTYENPTELYEPLPKLYRMVIEINITL